MSVRISSAQIDKLGHEVLEIRIRALKLISHKVQRAIFHGEDINFHPGILYKHLIRWFGLRPLNHEEIVLDLMLALLRSKYVKEIVNFLGLKRLIREVSKVRELLNTSLIFKTKVFEILQILEEYKINNNNRINQLSLNSYESTSTSDVIDLNSINSTLDELCTDNEISWSSPSTPDFNSLKLLNESLTSENEEEFFHGLQYLNNAIQDFPPEYFLQAPFKIEVLLDSKFKKNEIMCLIYKNIWKIIKSYIRRIKSKEKSELRMVKDKEDRSVKKMQMTPSKFCSTISTFCVHELKQSVEEKNDMFMYQIFLIFFEIINLITLIEQETSVSLFLLNELSYILKYYHYLFHEEKYIRVENRLQYIIVVYLASKLANINKKLDGNTVSNSNNNEYSSSKYYSNDEHLRANSSEIKSSAVWEEFEVIILDASFKHFFPEIHNMVYQALKFHSENSLKILEPILESDKVLTSLVKFLRQDEELVNDDYILFGQDVVDTFSIHESIPLIGKIIDAVTKSVSFYDGNPELRNAAECLILRLIAHDNKTIKRYVYERCAEYIKEYFGRLMSGEATARKIYGQEFKKTKTFGIPLTSEILIEIVCFGYKNEDVLINRNAETILCLLYKSESLLAENWKSIQEMLFPCFPLLQSLVSNDTELGKAVLSILNPDSNLESSEVVKGNIRFLYSKDETIRKEAISRLIYILSVEENANSYRPNILELSDNIKDDICILNPPRDIKEILHDGNINETSILPLLEILKNPCVEQSIRISTLLQLNFICQDPKANVIFHDEEGWYYVLEELTNSLRKDLGKSSSNIVIPAIGILTKLILCNPSLRRVIAEEKNVYFLLLRALILYPINVVLRQDCAIALFLLSFDLYVTGSKEIMIPKILNNLILPINCEFNLKISPFIQKNLLEKLFTELEIKDLNKLGSSNNNLYSSHESSISSSKHVNKYKNNSNEYKNNSSRKKEACLQYLRLNFGCIWFNGYNNILKYSKLSDIKKNELDYLIKPKVVETVDGNEIIEIKEGLKFDDSLRLKKSDIHMINSTSLERIIKRILRNVNNATNCSNVLFNTNTILLTRLLNVPMNIESKEMIEVYKRFIIAIPCSDEDILVYKATITLFHRLIPAENIMASVLNEIKERHCTFLAIIRNSKSLNELFFIICEFLEKYIKSFLVVDSGQITLKRINSFQDFNIFNYICENIAPLIEKNNKKHNIERLRSLINIFQFASLSKCTDLDSGYMLKISGLLFDVIKYIKSLTQAGSYIVKNCLMIVRNLMSESEFILDCGEIKFLLGLCAHECIEVRTLAWCIFENISRSSTGAELLIKELSFLPGGLHACCISTFLDTNEAPIVRVAVGDTLANFLSFLKPNSKGQTNMGVIPMCMDFEFVSNDNGFSLIKEILYRHKFFEKMNKSLENFNGSENFSISQFVEIITCGIVRSYCSIIINYICIAPNEIDELSEKGVFYKIFGLSKHLGQYTSNKMFEMVAELSNLLFHLLRIDSNFSLRSIVQENEIIITLIHALSFCENNKNLLKTFSPAIVLNTLRVLINETETFRVICHTIAKSDFFCFLKFAIESLEVGGQSIKSLLEFIIVLCIKSQLESFTFDTFATLLDIKKISLQVDSKECSENNSQEKLTSESSTVSLIVSESSFPSQKVFNSTTNENKEKYVSEFILLYLKNFFGKLYCHKEFEDFGLKLLILETIAVLLKVSPKARSLARLSRFIDDIINTLEKLTEISCTEFVRKKKELKKEQAINEISKLFEIIRNWYSEDCLIEEDQITRITNIYLAVWPLTNYSFEIRMRTLECAVYLSEDSIAVCKQFTATFGGSHSLLYHICNLVASETSKIKYPTIDLEVIRLGLRTIANCCCCIEGRLYIIKSNLLDIFSKFHPTVTKMHKTWNPIIKMWLEFWEIYSRHQEGSKIHNLILLCNLISRYQTDIRILCLTIIRNMAFLNPNKAALLTSDVMCTIKSIIKNGSMDERFLTILIIWKLIAGNYKSKHVIKNTSIPSKLKELEKNINITDHSDLNNILSIVNNILND